MKLEVGAKTDVGLVRDHNEDSFCVNIKNRTFIVADGMGGHAAGEVASAQLKDYIEEFVISGRNDDPEGIDRHLQEAVSRANSRIFNMGLEDPTKRGMGTTATILVFTEDLYYLAHVGDSRGYLFRTGELSQLTKDHSKVYQLYEHGLITKEEIENHPFSNIITRSIGTRRTVEADIYRGAVREGDRYMLCSDGLSGEVKDRDIAEVLKDAPSAQEAADDLVRRALRAGGRDNVTVLVVDVIAREGAMRQTVPISKKDVERILAAEASRKDAAAAAAAAAVPAAESSSSPSPPPPSSPITPPGPFPPPRPVDAPPSRSRTVLLAVAAGLILAAAVLAALLLGGGPVPVVVETIPPGAEVYVNGAFVGKTPWSGLVEPGEHHVTVALTGYEKERLLLKTRAGATQPVRKSVPLAPVKGRGAP